MTFWRTIVALIGAVVFLTTLVTDQAGAPAGGAIHAYDAKADGSSLMQERASALSGGNATSDAAGSGSMGGSSAAPTVFVAAEAADEIPGA